VSKWVFVTVSFHMLSSDITTVYPKQLDQEWFPAPFLVL
jgi:hypothetical protein